MRHFLQFIVFAFFIDSHLYAKPLFSLRIRRNALRDLNRHWPNGIVPYTIEKSYTEIELRVIGAAMKDIQSVSCIQFKKRSDEEDYVKIEKGEGCSSLVGHYGGRQDLTLGDGCMDKDTIIHELFHTLGFSHEHTRPDRDKYIKVNDVNVKPAHMRNFRKKSPLLTTTLDLPYDFRSVLHYRDNAFALDRWTNTLSAIEGNPKIGNAKEMSLIDILKLNRLYPCRRNKKRQPWVIANKVIV